MTDKDIRHPGVINFSDDGEHGVEFSVDTEARTISGLALPFNAVGNNGWARWKFEQGSVRIPKDVSRVKLLRDHMRSLAVGYAMEITETPSGLIGKFKVARGQAGDEVLSLAQDKVLDGMSAGLAPLEYGANGEKPFAIEEGTGVRVFKQSMPATLAEVSIVSIPAFADARVDTVRASQEIQEGAPAMGDKDTGAQTTAPAPTPGATTEELKAMFEGFGKELATQFGSLTEAITSIERPTGGSAPANTASFSAIREPMVYGPGSEFSVVRDAWRSKKERGQVAEEAAARLRKYEQQTAEMVKLTAGDGPMFAADSQTNTVAHAAAIPPKWLANQYIGQLPQGRPICDSFAAGSISDPTPFSIPIFVSATDMVDDSRVEGDHPASGSLVLSSFTVAPVSRAGAFTISREMVDSSNPALDAIARNAMNEDYRDKTELLAAAHLRAAAVDSNSDGRTDDGGYVQTVVGDGTEFIDAVQLAQAKSKFRRRNRPNRLLLAEDAYTDSFLAKDLDGRYLLPRLGATNALGTADALNEDLSFGGLRGTGVWSLDGTADPDGVMFTNTDVWKWESPLLQFTFFEKYGPEKIEIALFGYFAVHWLRADTFTFFQYSAS